MERLSSPPHRSHITFLFASLFRLLSSSTLASSSSHINWSKYKIYLKEKGDACTSAAHKNIYCFSFHRLSHISSLTRFYHHVFSSSFFPAAILYCIICILLPLSNSHSWDEKAISTRRVLRVGVCVMKMSHE